MGGPTAGSSTLERGENLTTKFRALAIQLVLQVNRQRVRSRAVKLFCGHTP